MHQLAPGLERKGFGFLAVESAGSCLIRRLFPLPCQALDQQRNNFLRAEHEIVFAAAANRSTRTPYCSHFPTSTRPLFSTSLHSPLYNFSSRNSPSTASLLITPFSSPPPSSSSSSITGEHYGGRDVGEPSVGSCPVRPRNFLCFLSGSLSLSCPLVLEIRRSRIL